MYSFPQKHVLFMERGTESSITSGTNGFFQENMTGKEPAGWRESAGSAVKESAGSGAYFHQPEV